MKRRINRLTAGLLAFMLMLSVIPFAAPAYAGESDPDLTIGTPAALQAFADAVNSGNSYEGKTVKLTANLALGGDGNPWTPIGTEANPFRGTFDGGYHVISELYIASGSSVGLFGDVNGGTVMNLVVQGEVNGNSNAAGVIGSLTAGRAVNCGNEAAVSGGANVGGVVGMVNGDSTVSGCFNRGTVTGTTGYVGGVTGQHWRAGRVENCYNAGTVTGPATVGGVTGGHKAASPALENCFNAGSVVDSVGYGNNVGAVIGAGRGTLTNCYYLSGTGTDAKCTEAETLTAAQLGEAFADADGMPVLKWESAVSGDTPVRPGFTEKTALSAQLATYIRAAVASAGAQSGIGGSLLGNEKYLSGASSTATDWMALAMGRFGYRSNGSYTHMIDDGAGYADYLAAMQAYIEKKYADNGGSLHSAKATEWHRAVVAIAALGGDPTAFGSYNGKPIDLIADGSYNCILKAGPGTQGLNGWIWGLLAMDAGMYPVPDDAQYPRSTFITEILKLQLTDGVQGNTYGGWVLGGFGTASDPDMTAMAIQALAPYYNDDTVYTYTNGNSGKEVSRTVRQCVEDALDRLGSLMNQAGGFSSWNTDNAESAAQVLVALCAVGIDPAKDARFITSDGKTVLDGLLRFRLSDGGFCHIANGGWNSMANDQATYALVAYWRFENGMNALYDMRAEMSAEAADACRAATDAIAAADDTSAADYKAQLKAALALFRAVPESERRYVRNYSALVSAIALVGGEAALDTDAPYITSVSVTQAPERTHYYAGEVFDPAGLVVTAQYSDGHTEELKDYRLSVTGELSLEDGTVYVLYGMLKARFALDIQERMPWQGAGTQDDPYRIGTAEELTALAERVNAGKSFTGVTFRMTGNIDLSNCPDWVPIGRSASRQFDGTFDGQGYAIDNLYSGTGGLFGYVGTNAVIRNVGVASGEVNAGNRSFIGAVAGWSNGADFINCWNGADIICGGWSGGIVGTVRDGGASIIRGCYNVGTVTARDGAVGGIVGHLGTGGNGTSVNVTVSACYNAGTVTASDNAGGIVGRMQDGHVLRNCYNAGSVTVTGENILNGAGGIASLVTSRNEISGCYYDSALTACGVSDGNDVTVARTAEEMRTAAFLALLGNDFKADAYALVNGGCPLLTWQSAGDADSIDRVSELIAAIGTVTPDSGDAIRAARAAYDALPDEHKALVDNRAALTAAEEALEALRREAETETVTETETETVPAPEPDTGTETATEKDTETGTDTQAPDTETATDKNPGTSGTAAVTDTTGAPGTATTGAATAQGCTSSTLCGFWLVAVLGIAAATCCARRKERGAS